MNLDLIRFHHSPYDTLGLLLIDGKFACFVLEDEYREEKVPGETRIPDQTYRIGLRYSPSHSPRYGHEMLYLQDVPGFTGILIHKGNTEKDTAGCLLVGDTAEFDPHTASRILSSTRAYDRIYPIIASAVPNGVEITVRDFSA